MTTVTGKWMKVWGPLPVEAERAARQWQLVWAAFPNNPSRGLPALRFVTDWMTIVMGLSITGSISAPCARQALGGARAKGPRSAPWTVRAPSAALRLGRRSQRSVATAWMRTVTAPIWSAVWPLPFPTRQTSPPLIARPLRLLALWRQRQWLCAAMTLRRGSLMAALGSQYP